MVAGKVVKKTAAIKLKSYLKKILSKIEENEGLKSEMSEEEFLEVFSEDLYNGVQQFLKTYSENIGKKEYDAMVTLASDDEEVKHDHKLESAQAEWKTLSIEIINFDTFKICKPIVQPSEL